MSGGTVVVLGSTGRNFAAGMSGGIAYVLDEDASFAARCNTAMVRVDSVLSGVEQHDQLPRKLWHRGETDEVILKSLIERHLAYTGSEQAKGILDDWKAMRVKFVKVFPNEYRRALGELAAARQTQPLD